ncbi:MAG TPA: hypothetical protein VGL53_10310 [Bryobacteraceae bacterium]|jgi:hypothetical protein
MIARLIQLFASTLDRQEREAILGDLAESGGTGMQALRDVVGLWLRRQLAAWKVPAPWIALLGFVLPFGLLLGAISVWVTDFTASIFGYRNNWRTIDQFHFFVGITFGWRWLGPLMLASWSWSLGFAIGSLSRRAAALNGLLLTAALTVGALTHSTFALRVGHAPPSYRIAVPFVVTALCV